MASAALVRDCMTNSRIWHLCFIMMITTGKPDFSTGYGVQRLTRMMMMAKRVEKVRRRRRRWAADERRLTCRQLQCQQTTLPYMMW